MTNITCGLTAKKPGSAPCPTLVIEYGNTLLSCLWCWITTVSRWMQFITYPRTLSEDTVSFVCDGWPVHATLILVQSRRHTNHLLEPRAWRGACRFSTSVSCVRRAHHARFRYYAVGPREKWTASESSQTSSSFDQTDLRCSVIRRCHCMAPAALIPIHMELEAHCRAGETIW